jgi:hypothetical protein
MNSTSPVGRHRALAGGEAFARVGEAELALAALVLLAVVLRAVAALDVAGPWIEPDEAAYALIGRGFWEHGHLDILGGQTPFYSLSYPVLAGIPLELGGLHAGYAILRVLQAIVVCSTAVVVYAWARSVARPPWALVAAGLTLALPGLTYAGALTADVLYVPLGVLAAWTAVRALEHPTLRNQAFLVAAVGACLLTRPEGNALVLAVVLAALATRRVRPLAPTMLAFAAIAAVWFGLGGRSPLHSFGGSDAGTGYTALRVVDFVSYHAAELVLVTGVLPVCAAVLLVLARPVGLRLRLSLAVALSLAAVTVAEAGVFAAGHAGHLVERELLPAMPPLLVAFAVWLDRGAPRPLLRMLAVVGVVLGGLLALPIGSLATSDALADNPSLVGLVHVNSPKAYGIVALVALVACALLIWLPGRRAWALAAAVGAVLAAASVGAGREFAHQSRLVERSFAAGRPQWIQSAATAPVTFLYDGDPQWRDVWTQLFWNPRLSGVIDLPTALVPGPLPQRQLQILQNDGLLRLVGGAVPEAGWLAATGGLRFAGERIAVTKVGGPAPKTIALWQLHGAPRVTTWAQDVLANGDIDSTGLATLDVFNCGRGTFHLVAVGRDNETVTLAQNDTKIASYRLWPGGTWEQTITTPPARNNLCTFAVSTTSLVHLAEFSWVPAR